MKSGRELPDRDPLEKDLFEVEEPLDPEEAALHIEIDGEWPEGRDLTADEIEVAHYREYRGGIEPHLVADVDGHRLD